MATTRKYTKTDFALWGRAGGLKGGRKGGLTAANNMTAVERRDRATRAAQARVDNLRRREADRLADMPF